MYIIHFLLEYWFTKSFGPDVIRVWIEGVNFPVFVYFLVASALTFLLAMASYHLFEVRFLRIKARL
jgi:peptidoglycan/LPS O-acetylase OafA/YrhL